MGTAAFLGIGAVLAITGCAGGHEVRGPAAPPSIFQGPTCDLVTGANLAWMASVKPQAIASIEDLIPAIGAVVPDARFQSFATAHGGVDLRRIDDLCVAHYRERARGDGGGTLVVARTGFEPARVEAAFGERSTRMLERTRVLEAPPSVRLAGELRGQPEELTIFGRDLLVHGQGELSPMRAAEGFALGKLRKARPAMSGAELRAAADALGDAPVRVFFPGPFEGESAAGLGGLLQATTSVGVSVTFAGPPSKVTVRLVLGGGWGSDTKAAEDRLIAVLQAISKTGLGKLFGLDHPLAPLRGASLENALRVEATYDGMEIARGLHDALDADVAEIMGR